MKTIEQRSNEATKLNRIKVCLALFLCSFVVIQSPATPFFGKIPNSDGSFQTNLVLMQAYPPANTWTVYGTNIVYGGRIITNVPNSSGYFSNWCYPNLYRVTVPALASSFYVNILDTTNFLSLSVYITNAPVVTGTYLDGYGLVTNWLGYAPLRPTYAAVSNVLGFLLPTNSNFELSNSLATTFALYPKATYAGISNAVGFLLATNTPASLSNTLAATFALYPFATYAGISNALGFLAATNDPASLSNTLTATFALYPFKTYAGLTNALGFVPGTNTPGLSTNQQFTALGVTNTAYVTNGILQRISTP